jgi:hypothetical protein
MPEQYSVTIRDLTSQEWDSLPHPGPRPEPPTHYIGVLSRWHGTYGFIEVYEAQANGWPPRVQVSLRDIPMMRPLKVGTRVQFKLAQTQAMTPQAIEVRVLSLAPKRR